MTQGVAVTSGQFWSGRPGTLMILFFVLLPACARLPRRFSLLCYTLFPFLACLPYLMAPDTRLGWSVVAGVVPGFLASIAFAEVLTRRDREVLSLVAMGFSNKEIAERLFLAEGAVKNRVSLILEKIGARDRTQAALRARDLGLL